MSGTNGRPPLAFPAAPAIPIVGQPFTIKQWFVQLVGTCNCSPRPEPVLIIGQVGAASAPCPLCGRVFVLQGVKGGATEGQLHLSIGMMQPAQAGDPPAT